MKQIDFYGLRHDGLKALFESSPLRRKGGTLHMPLIVIYPEGSTISVVRDLDDLLECDEDCWVICVWPGKKRSDVFRFRLKDFLDYVATHPKDKG